MTDMTMRPGCGLAKGAGAVAGSAISLAYILPHGRREAAVRFAVGLVCGLVFGGTAGPEDRRRTRHRQARSAPAETVLMGAAAASLCAWWGLGFVLKRGLDAGAAADFQEREQRMTARRRWRVRAQICVDLVLDEVEADGAFSGYASLFGAVDLGKDMVERGAFAQSLQGARRGGHPHALPARPGRADRRVDRDHARMQRGLFVRGRLARNVTRAREVLSLMRTGALDGLSIGFRAVKARKDAASGVRRIVEADLWEISVVTFPMLPGARVETVKGAARCRRSATFERWLTRDAGLTRGEARTVIAKGYANLRGGRDAAPGSTAEPRRTGFARQHA